VGVTLFRAGSGDRLLAVRRRPSDAFHLVTARVSTGRLAHGSWFKGNLQLDRCDLSPDGAWWLYLARGTAWPHFWSGLSPVPDLSLDARWDLGVNWDFYGNDSGGGGYFVGDRAYVPCSTYRGETGEPPTRVGGARFRVAPHSDVHHPRIPTPMANRLRRDGWELLPPDSGTPYHSGPLDPLYDTLRDTPSARLRTAVGTFTLSVLHHPTFGRRYLHYRDGHPESLGPDARSIVPVPGGVAIGRDDTVEILGPDDRRRVLVDLSASVPPWSS
jgi:hypothetical protein